jgi:predicted dehydrogenase
MNRRYFLTGATAAAAAAVRWRALASPNDTVRVACIGYRGQGRGHIRRFSAMRNVELAALCDVDENVTAQRLKELEARGINRPAVFTDARKLLEDKSIDAVSIATPNHWHTLLTVWACQAGKDVYVEKPCSHNVFESRQIVAAARRYDRIVQHGTQARSSPAVREAMLSLQEGAIGEVYMARGLCINWRDTIGRKPVEPVPPGVHYDLWLGPAAKRPFTRNRFHYNWHWHWDCGNGDIGNQGIHEMDVCRWGLGVKYPSKVSAVGGRFMFDDDQETPNTMTATFEFDEGGRKKLLVFEVRHWISNMEAGMGQPEKGCVGNIFYGSKGFLTREQSGYKTYLGREQQAGPGHTEEGDHFANFVDAVRSRNRSALNAEIQEGAISCVLVHLANISYRLGRTVRFDAEKLVCTGDAEATRLLTRNYRAPFVVPARI